MSEENMNIDPQQSAESESDCVEQSDHTQIDSAELAAEDSLQEDVAEAEQKPAKKRRTVALKTCLLSNLITGIALIVATLMVTYTVCTAIFKKQYAENLVKGEKVVVDSDTMSEIDLLNAYIDRYFYGDVDKDKMMAAALKAYVAATGDVYATYYTLEELLANQETSAGRMSGIGIAVVNDEVEYNGKTEKCLHIYNVMDDSPAQKAGVLKGDLLICVGVGEENRQSVNDLGYDEFLEKLVGEDGSSVDFTVLRKTDGGYVEKEFSGVVRGAVETTSVMASKLQSDSSVGILTITKFNYTTPKQFENKIEYLKNEGCDKFIIDLRYNPGGLLVSIQAVLSYFLNEGDTFIQTKDSKGNVERMTIAPIAYESGDSVKCNVDREDIGKYRDLNMVVICNGGTASASELFVANFKDYGIAKVVGENTYGKGKMQDTFLLNYGLNGAVKLTTHMYFSGGDKELVGYDGVGIVPDVSVSLSDEALAYFPYILPQELDDQLLAAAAQFN
jgi:carboxyl-terminal processing protease